MSDCHALNACEKCNDETLLWCVVCYISLVIVHTARPPSDMCTPFREKLNAACGCTLHTGTHIHTHKKKHTNSRVCLSTCQIEIQNDINERKSIYNVSASKRLHQIHQTSMLELLYAGSERHNSYDDSTDEKTRSSKSKGKLSAKIICAHANSSALRAAKMRENYMSFFGTSLLLERKIWRARKKTLTKKNLIKKYSFMHFGDAARTRRRQTEVHLKRISFK